VNDNQPEVEDSSTEITTLVDHQREGRYVFAFCPICDHAEEARDAGRGRDMALSDSVNKIKAHLRKAHRAKTANLKISVVLRPPVASQSSI
jgi:hypothetical protein